VAQALEKPLPLVELLWRRETDGAALETPERRAGLERRLREIAGRIADETLRRYYGQELTDRLARLLGRGPGAPGRGRDFTPRRRGFSRRGEPEGGPVRIGAALANSPLFRGVRGPIAPRDALILLILMNHTEVLAASVEEVAGLEFASPEAAALRDALLRFAEAGGGERADLLRSLEESGLAGVAERLSGMVAHAALWSVRPEAAPADAAESLRQALVLHRRFWALNKELRAVEARLAENSTEQDLARMRDIQTQLTALDGAEAAVEGFGASSGRTSRAL
jgi:DNA primase